MNLVTSRKPRALFALLLITIASTCVLAQNTCDLGTQDWETGSNANPPDGWVRGGGSPNIGNVCSSCGEQNGRAMGFNTTGEFTTSPELTCAGTVTFDWHASGNTSNFTVEVQWTQTPDEVSTWQTFQTVSATGIGPAQKQYMTVAADLPEDQAIAPFDVYVRWIMTERAGGTFYLDNICLGSGTCTVQPTQLTFTQLPPTCIESMAPFTVTACATDVNGFVAETFTDEITIGTDDPTVVGGSATAATAGCLTLQLVAQQPAAFDVAANSPGLLEASAPLEAVATCPNEITVKVMAYNLLNFPNGRDRCEAADDIVLPNRQDTLVNIVEYVAPDVIMVCELQDEIGSDAIIAALKGLDPNYEAARFLENTSTIVKNLNNMLYYNSAKMTLVEQSVVETNTRDISRYRMRMNDPKIATAPDTVFVDFFVAHLKAGNPDPDRARRAEDVATFQAAFDGFEIDNAVIGGDMNFYQSSELAYQTMLNGANPWFDPADAPGDWDNNVDFADIHTQASRVSGTQSYACGIPGGMDSRFDFLLMNGPIENETMNVAYREGTYEVPGNNGELFNRAINDPGNSSGVPRGVLESLYFMSDHLPVTMELQVTFPLQELPVTLVDFTARKEAKSVELNWSVTDEVGFSHYAVERKSLAGGWNPLGNVSGGASDYSFSDSAPAAGANFYRLRMVDYDGSEALSPVRAVTFGSAFAVYPTVTSGQVYVRGAEAVRVTDALGRPVARSLAADGGLQLGGLPQGWYVVSAAAGDARRVYVR